MSFELPQTQVSVITMDNGKVLLVREGAKWNTPMDPILAFENISDAAMRTTFERSGITVDPQNVIFVSEVLNQKEAQHRVIIYLYAKYREGEAGADAKWVDVRDLGNIQDDMADEAVDAFYKFSTILRQSAGRAGAQA